MTDREMLLLAFGAIKAIEPDYENLTYLATVIEDHLYPPPEEKKESVGKIL